ncbi:hypothetical protein EXIGLDRAFT_773621 [Exidia glandulosa HHB12029]|uniref:Uncharacterized protein n=1 Tax=Exidia glandulosa HHB12029 TaxID=1314781 RepID=A0A165EQG4_EXIGL|nr:hypothetical protein EXIGLDRAFT_773621 [Exidia glandulosa HHB12029]
MPSSVVPEAAVLEQLPRATPESLEASQPVGGLSSTLDADTGTSVAQDKLAPTQETNVLIDCSLATARRNSDADQSLPMTVFTKPFALRRRSLDKVDEANADNPGDEYEDDILADLLDWVLETAKQFDTVTGDWSLITEFYKNSDGLRQGDDLRVEIQPHRLAGKVVGHVRAIAPGKVDTPAAAPVQLLYNPVGSSTSLHRPSGSRANSPVLSRSTSVTSETIGLGMTTSPLHSVRGSATSLDRADHSPPQSIRTLTRAPSPVSGAINAPAAATPLSIQSGFASFTPQPPEIVSSPSAPELHVQLASEETLATPVDGYATPAITFVL